MLAWFIFEYFTHNIDLISPARKNFRPQNTNDDTILADQSDYVWDLKWSHPLLTTNSHNLYSQSSCKSISTHSRRNTFKL